MVNTAATIDKLISKENSENIPSVIITSWNKAKIAPKLNCHSNLIHIYKSIAAKDKAIAIIPDLRSSALTFGPTFSTLLNSTLPIELVNFFFMLTINFGSFEFCFSNLTI
tara:strand:+ start:309 stop:638 length:330 start_codon:yes stop_codon:yes gene_type:complete